MAKPILELKPYRAYNTIVITNKTSGVQTRIHRAPDHRDDINLTVDVDENVFYDTDIRRTENLSARYNAEFIQEDDRVSDNVFGFYDVYIQRNNDDYIVEDGGEFFAGTEGYDHLIDDKKGYTVCNFSAGADGKIYQNYTCIIFTNHVDRVVADGGTVYLADSSLQLAQKIAPAGTDGIVQLCAFDSAKTGIIYSMIDSNV